MKNITKTSKWIIYLSLFVSGSVIFTAVLWFLKGKSPSGKLHTGILVGIIIIAAAAAVLVIFMRTSKNRNLSKLNKEYYEVYEHIADILQGAAMSFFEKKEVLSDILSFFLQAQEDNRPVVDVTGNDIEDFVKQIQESYGYRNKVLFHLLNGIQYSIFYIFLMYGYEWLKSYKTASFYDIEVSISILSFLIPLAFFIIPLIRYFITKGKVIFAVLSPLCMFALYVLFNEVTYKFWSDTAFIDFYANGEVRLIPSLFILTGWCILFIAAQLIKWYQRRSSIKKM